MSFDELNGVFWFRFGMRIEMSIGILCDVID